MLHEMNRFLAERGHDVTVLVPESTIKPFDMEGVHVERDTYGVRKEYILSSDVIVSHLDRSGKAINAAEYFHKPYIQIIHNTNRYGILFVKHRPMKEGRFVYVIYNSSFTEGQMKYPCPGMIVHPPVDAKRYKVTKRGDRLTLINLFWMKGSLQFQQIARRLPEKKFLGVQGGYGKQEMMPMKNIEYWDVQRNMKKVYAETRILLMPSVYESYGRTAVEAMLNGIPVIAAPTPGLKESLGDAGIFREIDDIDSWVEAIKELDDKKKYEEQSRKCLERFKKLKSQEKRELLDMEKFYENIILGKI